VCDVASVTSTGLVTGGLLRRRHDRFAGYMQRKSLRANRHVRSFLIASLKSWCFQRYHTVPHGWMEEGGPSGLRGVSSHHIHDSLAMALGMG
jgi:hypothetical protein